LLRLINRAVPASIQQRFAELVKKRDAEALTPQEHEELKGLTLEVEGIEAERNHTHARDPVSQAIVTIYNPRQKRWSERFAWNEDFTAIVGLTQTGRATVQALELNRPPLINLRRILFQAGEHPPATA
jgi:hypothetical protein